MLAILVLGWMRQEDLWSSPASQPESVNSNFRDPSSNNKVGVQLRKSLKVDHWLPYALKQFAISLCVQTCHSGSHTVPVGTAIPVPSRAGVAGQGGAAGQACIAGEA